MADPNPTDPNPTDLSRRTLMRGAAGVAALGAMTAGARAQGTDATGGDTTSALADRRLGNDIAAPPGDPIPTELTGRPFPASLDLPDAPTERLGWVVAGLGDFAINHMIPALDRARRSRLVGVVSGNPVKGAAVARARGLENRHVYSYAGFDAIADDDAIDVVYVVTPNALHEDLVVRALRAGKHVLCEKPMATTVAAAERMVEEADRAGRLLMTAYRAHFEPHNVRLKEMLDAGELGAVNALDAATHRPLDVSRPRDQWRVRHDLAGGGSLPDIGIYALNGALYFMDEMPVALAATVHSPPGDPRFAEIEDAVAVQLRFASGAVANLSSSYTTPANRITLYGDKALATLDPATAYHDNRLTVLREGNPTTITTDEQSDVQFHREMDHLSEAIQNGTPLRTPGTMGLRDVRLIEAIYRAALSGGWVDLNEDGSARA